MVKGIDEDKRRNNRREIEGLIAIKYVICAEKEDE
jgi:hypothetical protein